MLRDAGKLRVRKETDSHIAQPKGTGAQEIAARQFKQAPTNAAISTHMHVSIAV